MTRQVRLLPLLMAAAVAATALAARSDAAEVWDGSNYLRVPVRFGSDTRLVMPEPFDDAWERDTEVACTLLDAHTLIIRPRTASIEQRLTLRGRQSGTLYLARVSSALRYAPVVMVRNAALLRDEAAKSGTAPTVVGLLKAMMQGVVPPGFQIERTRRVLLDEPPYRIIAQQVWRSGRQTGVLAELTSTVPQRTVALVPANIRIRIPELGTLRAMAADRFELDAGQPSTPVYLVYGH